jgi:glycosyltransferase involved in cell wall biosynthesis
MHIVQVNTADKAGGAESVAWQLFHAYRRGGHRSSLIVGWKRSDDPDVVELVHDEYRDTWSRCCSAAAARFGSALGPMPGIRHLQTALRLIVGQPRRCYHRQLGREDFDFPGTHCLGSALKQRPDILHCHNLHGGWLKDGGYFDLAALPTLSRRFPVVVTLHDAWLLSGHCAHSFECERWKTGCGDCPDLSIYPAVKRDATAYNWRRKQAIFERSRLFVATPSRWLMDKVDGSMLKPGCIEQRVIPNGVDLAIFAPADKHRARLQLGLPREAKILVFAANGVKQNLWKDYKTMRAALARVAALMKDRPVLFVGLGDGAAEEDVGSVRIRFVPYEHDPSAVARYYQAADVYIHAARAETFPNTVIEAVACGIPVVATAVGGIPEQVIDGRTGFLVPAGDAEAMARQIVRLLEQESVRRLMAMEAEGLARERFDLRQQVRAYLDWYDSILLRAPGTAALQHAN